MRFHVLTGAALLALAVSYSANAASDHHGWYLGLEGGWVKVQDSELPALGYSDIQFNQDLGAKAYGVLGTAGYAFEGNWRLEFELGYRHNDVDNVDVSIGPNAGLGLYPANGGQLREWTGFVNAIYDIPIGRKWSLDIGVGVGVDDVRLEIPDTDGAGLLKPIDVENSVLAGQFLAGLTYRLSTHWDLDLNYRYLHAADVKLTGEICSSTFAIALVVVPPVTCVPQDDSLAMTKHTITIGLRYGFDTPETPAPPPPAAPVAAPPTVKHFVIFFGFNKCNITAEADGVLSEAAASAKTDGAALIKIIGHTDTVGSPRYNQKLSECRANAAKTNLVGKGVPDAAISAEGKGEMELMVQTGDGVKEPQNRRATVDLE
jgi:OOP family OmpA-OmpF porin